MIRYIVGIFILLDVGYQLFGDPTSHIWTSYYNLIHYGYMSIILMVCFKDKLIRFFNIYFIAAIFTIIYQSIFNIPFDTKEPLYLFGYIALMLLLIFSIHKIWAK